MREPFQTISYYKAGGPAHVPLSQAARLNPLDESAAPFGRARFSLRYQCGRLGTRIEAGSARSAPCNVAVPPALAIVKRAAQLPSVRIE